MTEGQTRYPLCWPEGWKRTRPIERARSRFKATPAAARDDLLKEIERHVPVWRRKTIILSTNIPTRKDGLPYANAREPADPGVALYWEAKKGRPMVIACDTFKTTWENMRAIHKTLEALRGIERWGASELLERAFTGFQALPSSGKAWWEVLGVSPHAKADEIRQRYHSLIPSHHPDGGGTSEKFHELRAAYEEACKHVEETS